MLTGHCGKSNKKTEALGKDSGFMNVLFSLCLFGNAGGFRIGGGLIAKPGAA